MLLGFAMRCLILKIKHIAFAVRLQGRFITVIYYYLWGKTFCGVTQFLFISLSLSYSNLYASVGLQKDAN